MGLFDEADDYLTREPPDDFDRPFYRTFWFFGVCALVVFLGLWAIVAFAF